MQGFNSLSAAQTLSNAVPWDQCVEKQGCFERCGYARQAGRSETHSRIQPLTSTRLPREHIPRSAFMTAPPLELEPGSRGQAPSCPASSTIAVASLSSRRHCLRILPPLPSHTPPLSASLHARSCRSASDASALPRACGTDSSCNVRV